jgi:hypothetical protein
MCISQYNVLKTMTTEIFLVDSIHLCICCQTSQKTSGLSGSFDACGPSCHTADSNAVTPIRAPRYIHPREALALPSVCTSYGLFCRARGFNLPLN